MENVPRSAYDKTLGLVYFARMLDKIRRQAAGALREEYFPFLGDGFDGRMCRYLGISHDAVKARTLGQGGADEEILEWAYSRGRRLSDEDVMVWNKFATKHGWRDADTGATPRLEKNKADSGLAHRADIVTFFDFYEADEGREGEGVIS